MRYLSILLLLFLASCSSNERDAASQKADTVTTTQGTAIAVPDFYRKYTGVLAGKQITAHLVMRSGHLSGTYYYESIGIPIKLWASGYDTTTSRYELTEAAGESQVWKVTVNSERVLGRWISPTQAFDIDLTEAQGADLVAWTRTDSSRARPSSPEPRAIVGVEFLLPKSNSLPLEKAMIDLFGSPGSVGGEIEDPPHAKNIDEFWERMRKDFFDIYSESMKDDAGASAATSNYSLGRSSDVHFDRDGMLVLGIQSYDYMGGAHGNGGTNFINFDTRTSRVWTLPEMITVDSAKLIALLDKEAHASFNIPENVPLVPNLLLSELYVPPNYFVTHKGITFSYWPYDIASYAQGEIQLFIPWSELRDLIKPAFVQRMQLAY